MSQKVLDGVRISQQVHGTHFQHTSGLCPGCVLELSEDLHFELGYNIRVEQALPLVGLLVFGRLSQTRVDIIADLLDSKAVWCRDHH